MMNVVSGANALCALHIKPPSSSKGPPWEPVEHSHVVSAEHTCPAWRSTAGRGRYRPARIVCSKVPSSTPFAQSMLYGKRKEHWLSLRNRRNCGDKERLSFLFTLQSFQNQWDVFCLPHLPSSGAAPIYSAESLFHFRETKTTGRAPRTRDAVFSCVRFFFLVRAHLQPFSSLFATTSQNRSRCPQPQHPEVKMQITIFD